MKRDGFTLVEIMIVVAIIGLLAAMGIPAILNSMQSSAARLAETNLGLVEKAKGMLQLPNIVHVCGQGVTNGTPYGTGRYTEENLMACIKNKTSLSELHFSNATLIPGAIGEPARYEYD